MLNNGPDPSSELSTKDEIRLFIKDVNPNELASKLLADHPELRNFKNKIKLEIMELKAAASNPQRFQSGLEALHAKDPAVYSGIMDAAFSLLGKLDSIIDILGSMETRLYDMNSRVDRWTARLSALSAEIARELGLEILASDYYNDVICRLEKLSERYNIEIIGSVPFRDLALPLYKVTSKELFKYKEHVLINAGVHGNEKAGVFGALNFLESEADNFPELGFVCYPCINPRGYQLNTRWNGDGAESRTDINRYFTSASNVPEARIVQESLRKAGISYICALDLHETMPDDGLTMALQYPDRDVNEWKETPDSFYMWEICEENDKRVGTEVIQKLKGITRVCDWPTIFEDTNSGGVIFYPEGAKNKDYLQGTSVDSYVCARYTDHAFTTETYGDLPVSDRAYIQQTAARLILTEISRNK